MTPLDPGSVIGVLGGGQLGRMLAMAGARLGYDVHVFTPESDSPASRVAAHTIVAPYEDLDAVRAFAEGCAVVTYEFENVPVATAHAANENAIIRPGAAALETAQDRMVEKRFARECGADTVECAPVESQAELAAALTAIGFPAVLKTRRDGYDGKGQVWIRSPEDAEGAFATLGKKSAILEAAAAFEKEVSLVLARGGDGVITYYDLAENVHTGGILTASRAPAAPHLAGQARTIGAAMAQRLGYVGVFAVEFFVIGGDRLLVNEFAPRVHNSGHWTQLGAVTDQFEQHMRAVAGLTLGDTRAIMPVTMENLIGPEGMAAALKARSDPGAQLHLYGKREAKPGRKNGPHQSAKVVLTAAIADFWRRTR